MIEEVQIMPNIIAGFVKNGVVVPNSPLPEGAQVEIQLKLAPSEGPLVASTGVSLSELRKMPREKRQAILAATAEMAEEDYRWDKELTGFDAFSEQE
jgi:hypothetical protein